MSAICLRSLYCKERGDRFAHVQSFLKSDESESLFFKDRRERKGERVNSQHCLCPSVSMWQKPYFISLYCTMYMYILSINHCDLQYSTGILYHNLSLPAVIFIDISIYIYSILSFQGRQKKNICKEDSMVGDNSTEESSIIPQVTTEDSMVGDNSTEESSIISQVTAE